MSELPKSQVYITIMLFFLKAIYLSRDTIDMKLYHILPTWVIFGFSFFILWVNYAIKKKKV